ncbi:MAG TPA: LysR family transcriptional regulator [Vicinamibacterales bacterium]|nr:LysR family transcriptional regulator [Vicinamibacterales bacterium]
MTRDAYEVMDLKSLRCFLATARHRSLTKAGVELGISEAAVSQRIKALETYLGVKLYESRGGHVQITAAGEQTARLAISVFGEIDSLEEVVKQAEETAQIVLASHDSVLRYLLPDAVENFCRTHPLARLRLIARPVEETIRLVRSNEVDLGVIPECPLPEELKFQAIATCPAYVLLRKGHPLAYRARHDFRALAGDGTVGHYPLIILEVQRQDGRLEKLFAQHQIPYNVAFEVTTIDTLKHYVARGLGAAVITGFAITAEDRQRMEVIEIPQEFGGAFTYGVVMRRDKHVSALLKSMLALLAALGKPAS